MGTLTGFLFAYLIGGLTFIPLLLALLFAHAYLASPTHNQFIETDSSRSDLRQPNDVDDASKVGIQVLAEKLVSRNHEADVAAGYFAVTREYVPGGINGKPPERTTPAGTVVAAESPSVYQSIYRSVFDRNKPSLLEINKGNSKAKQKARNVFFVVLRFANPGLMTDGGSDLGIGMGI